MQVIYRRRLAPTEADRYFIYIERSYLDKFSVTQGTVRIRFDKQEFKAKVDKQGRLFLGKFRDYVNLQQGCTVIFYKNPDGTFTLEVEGKKKHERNM